jgi:hypothetical protein
MLAESYSMIAICCMIGLNKMTFNLDNYGETTQTACCLFALLVILVYPLVVYRILSQSWNKPGFDEVKSRFEPIFEGLTTSVGSVVLTHPMYFLMRRVIMAVNVVFLNHHLIFQVMIMDFTIIAGVIISGYIPFETSARRHKEFLNETVVMCVLYCMICFSPFVPDIKAKQTMGYFCCFLVALHLAINIYLILSSSLRKLLINGKLWLARRKLAKQLKLNLLKK